MVPWSACPCRRGTDTPSVISMRAAIAHCRICFINCLQRTLFGISGTWTTLTRSSLARRLPRLAATSFAKREANQNPLGHSVVMERAGCGAWIGLVMTCAIGYNHRESLNVTDYNVSIE